VRALFTIGCCSWILLELSFFCIFKRIFQLQFSMGERPRDGLNYLNIFRLTSYLFNHSVQLRNIIISGKGSQSDIPDAVFQGLSINGVAIHCSTENQKGLRESATPFNFPPV